LWDGTSLSPSGQSFIEVNLPQALTGTWVLRLTWTNYLAVPAKGSAAAWVDVRATVMVVTCDTWPGSVWTPPVWMPSVGSKSLIIAPACG
jgi:hypothetical protein